MANFSVRKLATYEKADPLPDKAIRPLTETLRLIEALEELARDEEPLIEWLEAANLAFDGETPLAMIQSGKSDKIWEMVRQIRQGLMRDSRELCGL